MMAVMVPGMAAPCDASASTKGTKLLPQHTGQGLANAPYNSEHN